MTHRHRRCDKRKGRRTSAHENDDRGDHQHGGNRHRLGKYRGGRLSGCVVHGAALHPWLARLTTRTTELGTRVIVAENGAMTPRFLRRTPQDSIRPHVSPRDEYDEGRLNHQCGGNLSQDDASGVMLRVAQATTLHHSNAESVR